MSFIPESIRFTLSSWMPKTCLTAPDIPQCIAENPNSVAALVQGFFTSVKESAQDYIQIPEIPSQVCATLPQVAGAVALVAVVAFLAGKILAEEKEPVVQEQYVPYPVPVFIEVEKKPVEQPKEQSLVTEGSC